MTVSNLSHMDLICQHFDEDFSICNSSEILTCNSFLLSLSGLSIKKMCLIE